MARICTVVAGIVLLGFSISNMDVAHGIKLLASTTGAMCIALGSLGFGRR